MRLVCLCVFLLVGIVEGQQPGPDKAQVRRLQEKRRDVLREALVFRLAQFQVGQSTLDGIVNTSKELLAAELDLATTDGERIATHQRYYEIARKCFDITKASHAVGKASALDILEAEAVVLGAEIGLLKAGGKLKKAEK